jgi:hypothetical protein
MVKYALQDLTLTDKNRVLLVGSQFESDPNYLFFGGEVANIELTTGEVLGETVSLKLSSYIDGRCCRYGPSLSKYAACLFKSKVSICTLLEPKLH